MSATCISFTEHERLPEPGSLLVFVHVGRCGGTSLKLSLSEAGWPFLSCGSPMNWFDAGLAAPHMAHLSTPLFLAGHGALGVHRLFPESVPCRYVTMLRHPWSRFVSFYRYGLKHYRDLGGLADFLEMYPVDFFHDILQADSPGKARERLAGEFFAFGITERMGDSLALMGRMLGVEARPFRENTTAPGSEEEQEVRSEFERRHGRDMELYAWACELFEERFRALGISTPADGEGAGAAGKAADAGRAARCALVQEHLRGGRIAQAIQAIETDPALNPMHWKELAGYSLRLGDAARARDYLVRAAELWPDYLIDLVNLLLATEPAEAWRLLGRVAAGARLLGPEFAEVFFEGFKTYHYFRHARFRLDGAEPLPGPAPARLPIPAAENICLRLLDEPHRSRMARDMADLAAVFDGGAVRP